MSLVLCAYVRVCLCDSVSALGERDQFCVVQEKQTYMFLVFRLTVLAIHV